MMLGSPNNPRRAAEDEIAWAAQHDFDYLDLSLEPDRCLPDQLDPDAIRKARDRWGIGLVGHMAWYLPIGSPMPVLRRAALAAAGDALRAFGRLGVSKATIHTHWPPHYYSRQEGSDYQIESLRALVPVARENGVTLMLEPASHALDVPDHIDAILQAVPDLACHLDLGHCNLNGFSPPAWIRRCAAKTIHLHAHDNNGHDDAHLPPGTGTIDWTATIRALKEVGYDGTITIESFTPEPEYRCFGRDWFRHHWNSLGLP